MEIVKVKSLSKVYGDNEAKVEALRDVNLTINSGEFVAIIGKSGSGKSTLLHLLGGLDKPSKGKVIIDNIDIYSLKEKDLSLFRRRKIGFIFQFFNLIPIITVEENIAMPILLDNKKVPENYLEELLDILNLKHRRKHFPNELSGGQQQRVSIGRSLIYKPSIILADEPTGNLDTKNTSEVIDLLKSSIKKFNQTLILITHDDNIAKQADRVIEIEDGIIKKDYYLENNRNK